MSKEIGKTKKSIYNFITMFLNTFVVSLVSLISTNLIISRYGSDFNGVVATANQIVNLLLIVEGGFTLVINISLFKPYTTNNQKKIDSIMSAASKTFKKISLLFFCLGFIASMLCPFIIKSSLPNLYVFLIFLMVVFSTAYNLYFVVVSKIMFQVSQQEYIYTCITTIFNVLSGITTIILILNSVNMLFIRLSIMIYSLINGLTIYALYKKLFSKINCNVEPDFNSIKGTKDVMIQKATSVIYSSAPILFISTFIGTKMTSVYNVYYSIYNIIKNALYSLVNAPVNGFGQMFSKYDKKDIFKRYKLYEYIIFLSTSILLTITLSLIIPFVKIYTRNVSDINYINIYIALLLCLIVFLEIIHIPAGNIINVSGNFAKSREIQTKTSIILVFLLYIGGKLLNIYGILIANLLTNLILAYLEISFVYKDIFDTKLCPFIKKIIINIFVSIIIILLSNMIISEINSYFMFIVYGAMMTIITSVLFLIVNSIFYKKDIKELFQLLNKQIKLKK